MSFDEITERRQALRFKRQALEGVREWIESEINASWRETEALSKEWDIEYARRYKLPIPLEGAELLEALQKDEKALSDAVGVSVASDSTEVDTQG